jgi:DNA-binding LytR/AlgR family response regulator
MAPTTGLWVSGVEEGNPHPVDSEVDSQVQGVSRFPIHEVLHFWKREKGVAIVMGLSPQLHIAPKGPASRIAIKAEKKILFIDSADIIAVEAEGNYVLLQHKSSGYLLRESISTMAEKLSLFGFVRIHRSALVNAAFVEEIQPLSTGEYELRVKGGKKYIVTRTYKKNLHLLADSWIGSSAFVQIERGGLINSE